VIQRIYPPVAHLTGGPARAFSRYDSRGSKVIYIFMDVPLIKKEERNEKKKHYAFVSYIGV
jgi:hypothetical protein